MKQVVQNFRSGDLKLDEVPPPTAGAGQLLVANQTSLISVGTEKTTVSMAQKSLAGKAMERPDLVRKVMDKAKKDGIADTLRMVSSRLDTPVALGYSCAGVVLASGAQVEGFAAGDRVACAGHNYASHAEMVAVPKNLCVKIPEGLSMEEASYVTLGSIALQGVRQSTPDLGSVVAVIGLGLLGQLTLQMLKANGCRVVAADVVAERCELAKELGADEAVEPERLLDAVAKMTDGHGADVVIITASTKGNGPIELGAEVARRKGRVVVVGAVGMDLPRPPFYEKELELRLSMSYGPGRYDSDYEEKGRDYPYGYVRWTERRNMAAFLDLVAAGKVDVKRLTTHRFAIEDAESAYAMIMEGKEPSLGVVLTYGAEEASGPSPLPARLTLAPRSSSDKTRLAIIGAGNHVKGALLPALRDLKAAELAAVCTEKGVNAKNLAEKINADFCTTDYREILSDTSIDGVIIGTRHDTHADIVMAALEAGKHVFVEKPLCLTAAELEEITRLYGEKAAYGLQFMVGFNRRFSAHMEKAKEVFAGRREPLVMHYRVNAGAVPAEHWVQDPEVGGGRIVGEGCHFVDYLQELTGSEVTAVQAASIGHHASGITEDQASLTLSFADGSLGSILYSAAGDRGLAKERCEVFGSGAALVMDDFMQTEIYRRGRKEVFKTRKRDKGFQQQMSTFLAAVRGEKQSPMTFEQIDRVTRSCFLALESMRSGARYSL